MSQEIDRRTAPRFKFEVPLTLEVNGQTLNTITEDLSPHGIQFSVSEEFEPHLPEILEVTLTLTPEITLAAKNKVRCQARVVRKIRSKIREVGIAARIESYEKVKAGGA